MAGMYTHGRGLPKDWKEKGRYYRMASDQGHARAHYELGRMYENGNGRLPQDHKQAVEWYRRSAVQGNAMAQWQMGKMFRFGKGVPKDFVQNYTYFLKAESKGRSYSQLNKKEIAKKMTADEIERAKRISKGLI